MEKGVVVQGLDLMDVVIFISKKNKKFQAISLSELEEIIDKEKYPEIYQAVRKLILDGFNNYTRSIVRVLFGDIEYMIK